MVTIKEIAQRVHLSPAAVSRALRNDETLSIAPETRARILTAAAELGYVRPEPAGAQKNERAITIIHKRQTFRNQIDSSYYFAVRSGIEDACAKARVRYNFVAIEDLEPRALRTDGIILVGNYTQEQYTALLPALGNLPAVAAGIVTYYRSRFDHVSYSNEESVALALRHLFENGHEKIGYLGVEEAPGTGAFGSRRDAFIRMMSARGAYRPEWLIESDHGTDRVERGCEMAKKLAALPELPTALFCANDPIALGAINGLLECGLRVPDDISIVAHDGSYPTQYSVPALTTVDVHPYQLGVESTGMLLGRIEKPLKYTRELLLYPTLIKRASVRDVRGPKKPAGGR